MTIAEYRKDKCETLIIYVVLILNFQKLIVEICSLFQTECISGDRHFSPWKGSVVDSVVGVFLTQNVSDHLSRYGGHNLNVLTIL